MLKFDQFISLEEAKLSDMEIHNKLANRNLLIKAIKTAEKMGGNMTGAVREIEKMKKGLSKHKAVQAALRQANESVKESTAAYAASLERMANDKKLKDISPADRKTLAKLSDMMKNANK